MYDHKYDPKKEWVSDSDKAEGGQHLPEKTQPQVMTIATPRGGVKVYPGTYHNQIEMSNIA